MRPAISTRTGDSGKTGLVGGGRVSKSSSRIQAIGSIDELNAILGLTLAEAEMPLPLREQLTLIQRHLFTLGADVASPLEAPVVRLSCEEITEIERWGFAMEQALPPLQHFILPNGCRTSCLLHQARAVCRRAERWITALAEKEEVRESVKIYLNRLGDYIFLAARTANRAAGQLEAEWSA
ncbi:MAG: cob(I)yrinic acid a,c-diamide adenosyltransferase [Candidatus Peribacteraceae bacterium]|nr:cob(I)yrinic acid a,c-diamide adenosyltransferase [Candidatus Peribacteraceae bacterium]